MKRTTVVLSDQVAAVLEMERRRRGLSTAALIREAVEHYLFDQQKPLWFVGLGESQDGLRAADMEEYLAEHWADDIAKDSGLAPRVRPSEKAHAIDEADERIDTLASARH